MKLKPTELPKSYVAATVKAMDRRRFFYVAGFAASVAYASTRLLSKPKLAAGGDAIITAILRQHLGLSLAEQAVVNDFATSLCLTSAHTLPPAASRAMLAGERGPVAREQYVLQEFFIATNYRAWRRGLVPKLTLGERYRRDSHESSKPVTLYS